MKSPVISVVFTMVLIAVIVYEGFEIKNQLDTINQLVANRPKTKGKAKASSTQNANLEKLCQQTYAQTQKCLKETQVCLDVLGTYTDKNKMFDRQVKKCQDRNTKNSKRNNELKVRLDAVQVRTDKLKGKN